MTYIYFEVKSQVVLIHNPKVWCSYISLQDIRQNHWTVKYGSCWPSLHNPRNNVKRLSHVWPTICISCFHNRKVEKHYLKVSKILTSSPTQGHGPRNHGMKADPPGYLLSKYECFLMSGSWDIPHLRNFKQLCEKLRRKFHEHDRCTKSRTERQKLYTPWHKCRGYNYEPLNSIPFSF